MIREIDVKSVEDAVAELCVQANLHLPCMMRETIEDAAKREESPVCREVLGDMVDNIDCAEELNVPICQDTGMAVIFLEIGQDVHFTGGSLYDAVNRGVAKGYVDEKLRLSVVKDPIRRGNTNDNTSIVDGDKVRIMAAPKGFGSENMSRIKMFTPSASLDDIVGFVTETVDIAGSNPCPPIVLGVGIGGDFEQCAYLAKKALCRDLRTRNPDPFYAELEQRMLDEVNKTGIGSQGFGGTVTALYINIEQAPTHIAGLPVAVNVGCHVTRHKETVI